MAPVKSSVSVFYSDTKFGKSGMIPVLIQKPCFTVNIGNMFSSDKNNTLGIVVTNFDIQKAENISVTPTLGTQLFLYVGGESAWQINIQGILLDSCEGANGYNTFIEWYNNNNVKTTGKPIDLNLGNQTYKGYLYKFHIQSEYKFTNCFSFTATFVGVPRFEKGKRQ